MVLVAGLAAIALAAYFLVRSQTSRADSIAVLPFRNRTGDSSLAYITEGITESLIDDLSRIPKLRVIARGSVLRYDSPKTDPQAAGRELKVARIIDGSVAKRGDEFFLDTELIDVRSGVRLWGSSYPGKLSSLVDTLQQFSTEVTDQLRLKLSGSLKERLARQYATGSESYKDYLQGRFHLNKRTAADFQEAIRYFNRAIAADPNYAPAYSGLADAYGFMAAFGSAYGGAIPAKSLEQSRLAAVRALKLDGTLSEAYSALAFVEMQADYNWDGAERDFRRAIELNPNWPNAHELYAFDLGAGGRFAEAIREVKQAVDLDPNSLGVKLAYGQVLRMARQTDESLTILQRAAQTPLAKELTADYIAEDYWAKSMPAQALAVAESIPSTFTPHGRIPLLVAAYARAGQTDKARRLLNSYLVRPDTAWWYYLALAHLSLHEKEEAISDLQNAYEQRYEDVIWLGVDPMLDELRTNPQFRILLERIRRPIK
jgi:TolB-like protein/tetratricopeptide (TPR) repeat protein